MKVCKNYENYSNDKYNSLKINNRKKIIANNIITNNNSLQNNDNNFHIYCNTTENQPIESYHFSNINLNIQSKKNMIYYKNKFIKNKLFNSNLNSNKNYKYIIRANTIEYNEENTPMNTEKMETDYNKYIYNNNILRKNNTGLKLNKNYFGKLKIEKSKPIQNKSLKNIKLNNNKINLYKQNKNKIVNSFNYIKKNNNNRIINIKKRINKKIDNLNDNDLDEELLNSNTNDEGMTKELFNLLVKKLNKSIEENERGKKIIKKLKEENNKLHHKIISENKKNEILLKNKAKEIIEIKKERNSLKQENEKLKSEIMKLIMKIKENYNRNNKDSKKLKEDNLQLNQLDSICSSIGGLSAISKNSTQKE